MNEIVFLDGGMGTLLQAKGLKPGETPEDWNVERPDDVAAIHRAYVAAGAQVVYANTFGANRLKYHGRHSLEEVVRAGIAAAQDARHGTQDVRIALDLGPTGRLLKPAGDLDFDEAVAAFAETIKIATSASPGPDLIVIETMGDVRELKAAVLAAKETCDLPVYATVTLGADGKLLTGGSVECVAALLESLGVAAYGFNCGLGPDKMLSFVERLAKVSTKPIIAKPNAGLPKVVDGRTVFTVGPEEFAADVAKLVAAGASVVGGCCGTTPAHIRSLAGSAASASTVPAASSAQASTVPAASSLRGAGKGAPFAIATRPSAVSLRSAVRGRCGYDDERRGGTVVSSGTSVVTLRPHLGLVIGERINPTGKKALKEAYAKGDTAYVLREAVKQVDAGAEILDVNCGVPGLDERALLDATVQAVQGVAACPIQIDTANPAALELALRHVNGKPLVNSVNGKRESMDAVFPLVKKYGGAIVALCLDESGIPPTSEGRLAVARKILAEGAKYGFGKSDFVFDALTLSVSSDAQAAVVTLETVRRLTDELGVNTVLGVSNVSFGLPNRPALNNAMYALAKRAGLSAAIANPSVIRDELDPAAEDVLLGRDPNCEKWIAANAQASTVPAASSNSRAERDSRRPRGAVQGHCGDDTGGQLFDAIRRGLKEDAASAADELLKGGKPAMELIQGGIVPALEEVGRGFEKGTLYLPQLLMAAEAAGAAFAVVRSAFQTSQTSQTSHSSSPIVLATVKGDIHDIGKNIVRALLENYGFDVIDLGRDVPPERIVETAREKGAFLVGLSALMTTTVGAMAETVRQLKATGLACRTVVGGAVVTQDYADEIGADFYAKDAMRTVRIAESLRDRSA